MNLHLASRLVLAAAAAGCLASCATSTPASRIARNPDLFAALTPHQQERVSEGNIEKGLPKPGVFLAWGRPTTVSEWERNGRTIERWSYVGYRPVYYHSIGTGWGWSAYHPSLYYHDTYWQGGTTVDWAPYAIGRVEFTDGRVSFWEHRHVRRR
jgi:hypothetical protein